MNKDFIRFLYKDFLKLEMEIWKEKDKYYTITKFLSSVHRINDNNSWLKIMKPYLNKEIK